MWRSAVSLVNAKVLVEGRIASSIRFSARVLGIDSPPERSDVVVDIQGAFVLPGLVNAHDHLELNHFGRIKFRESYGNASSWIDDMRPKLREDPAIREGQSRPVRDRLLVGALKNLLCGVTTVSHHNPFYRELGRGFPIRVVRRYGWAHSLFLESGPDIARAYAKTPIDAPFLIHLAEGYDASAREEFARLRALGCLRENTVLVHGVGLSSQDWISMCRVGAGLVWCPSSNQFLLGRTAPIDEFLQARPDSLSAIALGSDSRLTGADDLLGELREARASSSVEPASLLPMVTVNAARLLRIPQSGRIALGLPADLTVIPPLADDPAHALLALDRSQIRLVAVGGRPLVGAPGLSSVFEARQVRTARVTVDGQERILDDALAQRLRSSSVAEQGLEF